MHRFSQAQPIAAAALAFRRDGEAPWSSLFGGRETAFAADGSLQLELPAGSLELRVHAASAGLPVAVRTIQAAPGAEITLRL